MVVHCNDPESSPKKVRLIITLIHHALPKEMGKFGRYFRVIYTQEFYMEN